MSYDTFDPTKDCRKCVGDGQIANDDDGTPWSAWANLPPGADLAVRMGLVRPVQCPDCKGTGTANRLRAECSQPQKYRKKPVEIEAMQFDGTVESANRVLAWIGGDDAEARRAHRHEPRAGIVIKTLEGEMLTAPGDYVIRGVQGEFYPCKPDIFSATYDSAKSIGLHPVTYYQAECTGCGTIVDDYYEYSAVEDPIEWVRENLDWFERTRSEPAPTPELPQREICHTVELLCPGCQKCEICGAEHAYEVDEHLVCDEHEDHDFAAAELT
ncbi:hypothetical protein [Mycolicibacterium wolinskyi]|uniref:hypothetical protein n=1 Tax=Mycolicibacterium wolinskyi TaxID=59750 RepID=UPI0039177996